MCADTKFLNHQTIDCLSPFKEYNENTPNYCLTIEETIIEKKNSFIMNSQSFDGNLSLFFHVVM